MRSISDSLSRIVQPSEGYRFVTALFLRALGLIYLVAFFSLFTQIIGLVGAEGILPFRDLLDAAWEQRGPQAWLMMPNLFWLDSSDLSLQAACLLGCALSLALVLGARAMWIRIVLFACYLSLFHAGQTFLSFQWDSLLLEAGFLAIFLTARPSALLLFLFHWLLFRLRFMSGVAKLATDDPVWGNLSALLYYFETQPLPHTGAWYFHQLPEWMLYGGTIFMFFTELVVPLFIFMGRRFRITAAAITILMQLIIIATSNHNWINLLTIALCLFLLDDDVFRGWLPKRWFEHGDEDASRTDASSSSLVVLSLLAALAMTSSVSAFTHRITPLEMPIQLRQLSGYVRAWGIGHIFHLFPTMQTERHELQIEGSMDGKQWYAYGFRYKPGALERRPAFIVPHQPRLDWMLWFIPARPPGMMPFFDALMERLSVASPEVLALIEHDPFAGESPKYLRVQVFRYRFTDRQQREQTGNWWQREYLGLFPYVPPRRP